MMLKLSLVASKHLPPSYAMGTKTKMSDWMFFSAVRLRNQHCREVSSSFPTQEPPHSEWMNSTVSYGNWNPMNDFFYKAAC